ncbi:MAG: hypothetical protein ACUVTQ_02345 [Desulfotomaculales bacterium]
MNWGVENLRRLPERDLRFIVNTVATRRRDHDYICELVRDKPDLIDIMLNDERLFQRVMHDEEILLHISPYLLFTILLRQVKKELSRTNFTMEKIDVGERIPVFDSQMVGRLLDRQDVQDYLAHMLASFTKTETVTVALPLGEKTFVKRYSDLDPEDLEELASIVEERYRFPLYKRLGDICLFMCGIFPEYLFAEARRKTPAWSLPARKYRSMQDYEEVGRRFYQLAAQQEVAGTAGLSDILGTLAENFHLARKPLNYLADRYIHWQRGRWFGLAVDG